MILALQYYNGDREAAFRLARLLADLEPRPRFDVILALCCQPDTTIDDETVCVIEECSRKFAVEHVVSQYGCTGWADGSGQLWRGTVTHFLNSQIYSRYPYNVIFTFDGSDGVPLHVNWIDLTVHEHYRTRAAGKRVTGLLNLDVPEYPHVHGNMIFDLDFAREHPTLFDTPLGASAEEWWRIWDVYHAHVFLSEVRPSSVVCNHWNRQGVTEAIMDAAARESIWLHGYKDLELADVARRRLLVTLEGKSTTPVLRRQDQLVPAALQKARDNAARIGYGLSKKVCDPRVCDPRVCDLKVCDPKVCDPRVCDPKVCDPRST